MGDKGQIISEPLEASEGTESAQDFYAPDQPLPKFVEPETPKEPKEPRDWSWLREWVSNGLEVLGILVVSYGFFLIKPWAGVICLGLGLILIGMAVSRPGLARETADDDNDEPQAWQMGPT